MSPDVGDDDWVPVDDPLAHIPKLIEQLRSKGYWLQYPDRLAVAASLEAAQARVAALTEEVAQVRELLHDASGRFTEFAVVNQVKALREAARQGNAPKALQNTLEALATALAHAIANARWAVGAHNQTEMERKRANEAEQRAERYRAALEFYANPDTYFAIAFMPDPPNGEFMDDFSDVETEWGPEYRPGKRARQALVPDPARPATAAELAVERGDITEGQRRYLIDEPQEDDRGR